MISLYVCVCTWYLLVSEAYLSTYQKLVSNVIHIITYKYTIVCMYARAQSIRIHVH